MRIESHTHDGVNVVRSWASTVEESSVPRLVRGRPDEQRQWLVNRSRTDPQSHEHGDTRYIQEFDRGDT
jgi:hypothetical protein